MRLVFLGPPGAGKGTQAERLCRNLDLAHISTGNILRKAAADGTELGMQAKRYMEAGDLVPHDIIVALVADALHSDDGGFILDGFPRTIAQVEALDDALRRSGKHIDLVIYFDASEETIIARLTGRRICRQCGANYHIVNMKPKVEGVCDRCGGQIYQREDDEIDTIRQRIKVYLEETGGLIDYYRERGLLEEVPGDSGVSELGNILLDLLKDRVG